MSIIQIKNGIDKYWRKTAAHAIKKEDKETIKRRALEAGIVEPAPLLALHNALTIAKVLRHELTSGEWWVNCLQVHLVDLSDWDWNTGPMPFPS